MNYNKLFGGSKEFLKTNYFKEEIDSPRNKKSKSKGNNSSISFPYKQADLGDNTDRLQSKAFNLLKKYITQNKEKAPDQIRSYIPKSDEYMFQRLKTPSKPSSFQKGRVERQQSSRKIITVDTSIQPNAFFGCQSAKNQLENPVELSLSDIENDFFITSKELSTTFQSQSQGQSPGIKKLSRPPTAGGYYHNKKDGIVERKTMRQASPYNGASFQSKINDLMTSRSREKNIESSFVTIKSPGFNKNLSFQLGRDSVLNSRRTAYEKEEQKPVNIHVKNMFETYFQGWGEEDKRSNSLKKTMTSSPHSMFRLKSNKEHLKERYGSVHKINIKFDESFSQEESLLISKMDTNVMRMSFNGMVKGKQKGFF